MRWMAVLMMERHMPPIFVSWDHGLPTWGTSVQREQGQQPHTPQRLYSTRDRSIKGEGRYCWIRSFTLCLSFCNSAFRINKANETYFQKSSILSQQAKQQPEMPKSPVVTGPCCDCSMSNQPFQVLEPLSCTWETRYSSGLAQPSLTIASIWWVTQQMEDLCVCVILPLQLTQYF